MPIAIIEAMMAGRVVITTDIGGNAEHIIDNENGFIANAPNLNSLDEALERAWAMHKSWEQIGSKARDHIISKINFDPVVKFCDKITNIKNLSNGN
jgi:glycosyltransferase involved in cell wall biosynthesis